MWKLDFIRSVQIFSLALTPFKGYHLILFNKIREKDDLPSFPYTNNIVVEKCLLKLTATIFGDTIEPKDFSPEHSYYSYMWFIYEVVLLFWERFIDDANFDTSGFFDTLVRNAVMYPPGIGIGYLSLLIARHVDLSNKLLLHIETSKALTPSLPFRGNERKDLAKIAGSEDRLRLALLITRELGIVSKESDLSLSTFHFKQSLWDLLYYNGMSNLEILKECLCRSERCLFIQGRKFTPNVLLAN